MPSNLPNANALSYLGVRASTPPDLIKVARDPTTADRKGPNGSYQLGQQWLNTVTNVMWVYVANNSGLAIWDKYAGSTAGIDTITGDSGGAVGPLLGNLNLLGGVNTDVVGDPSTYTLTINNTGAASFAWNEITVTGPTSMSVDQGYVANNAALVELALPSTAAFGTVIKISGKGAGGWKITQNAGQNIQFIANSSTVGVTGYAESTQQYDSLDLLCIVADTTWVARNIVGNIGYA